MSTRWQLILSLIWLLSLLVLLTLLGAWGLFPVDITRQHLTDVVDLSASQIMHNFNQLMMYLLNPFQPSLKLADFPVSASGAKHFTDVKHLFVLTEGLCLILLLPAQKGLNHLKTHLSVQPLLWLLMALPLVIAGLAAIIGFDRFFVLFHTLLFPGDSSWLFNPVTDPVIYILPETFFLHCFILFLFIYESTLGLLLVANKRYNQRH